MFADPYPGVLVGYEFGFKKGSTRSPYYRGWSRIQSKSWEPIIDCNINVDSFPSTPQKKTELEDV